MNKSTLKLALLATLGCLSLNAMAAPTKADVTYSCETGGNAKVTYTFNQQGVPTKAFTKINGKTAELQYDLNKSTDQETYFTNAKGEMIGVDYLDATTYKTAGALNIFDKNSMMEHKACTPTN